jgi:hypothetical protein
MVRDFDRTGWTVFPPEPAVTNWVRHARQDAMRALSDPDLKQWYQCEGTWFVGLDALDNDAAGRIGASEPLSGAAMDFLAGRFGGLLPLHKGQMSGVFPGYPRPRVGESDAAFRYRRDRDAAHVDGVMGIGAPKRRFVQEPHAFILGLPLSEATADAAPLVVWEGSHLIMQAAFAQAFADHDPAALESLDVTDAYQAARKAVFETCARVVVHGAPGSAYVVHRLALHGVAPWASTASSAPEGRLIAYFRPPMPGGAAVWFKGR